MTGCKVANSHGVSAIPHAYIPSHNERHTDDVLYIYIFFGQSECNRDLISEDDLSPLVAVLSRACFARKLKDSGNTLQI